MAPCLRRDSPVSDTKNDKDLIVWDPDDSGGNAVIAILAGELDLEPETVQPEPPLATPPKTPIKVPNQ